MYEKHIDLWIYITLLDLIMHAMTKHISFENNYKYTTGSTDLCVRLPLSSYYGPVSVQRYGLWGHVCSAGFGNEAAMVACRELSYTSGVAVHTYQTQAYPIIQGL